MEYNGTYGFLSLRVRRFCDQNLLYGTDVTGGQVDTGRQNLESLHWCPMVLGCGYVTPGLMMASMIGRASFGSMILYSLVISIFRP